MVGEHSQLLPCPFAKERPRGKLTSQGSFREERGQGTAGGDTPWSRGRNGKFYKPSVYNSSVNLCFFLLYRFLLFFYLSQCASHHHRKVVSLDTSKCWRHGLDSDDLAPSSPPSPNSRRIHLGLTLEGKSWILTEDVWGGVWADLSGPARRTLHRDRRWLTLAVQATAQTNTQ